jgi:quinol monooxygenase YgiN|tara:strand:+ start:349 stop:642 length:294 start_codon:yes stop_codon:yes gene_type:complete
MPITITLTFSVKPERTDEFKSLLESLLPDTRAYDGCLRVDVYQDQDDPSSIILVEDWTTKEHQQKYQAWRDETGIGEVVGPLLAGEPIFRYLGKLKI